MQMLTTAPALRLGANGRANGRALRGYACMHVLTTALAFRTGSDSELTVDPTPFTVVTATNPRHQPGTRLLIVHENSCVDAVNGAVNGAVATPRMHALTTAPFPSCSPQVRGCRGGAVAGAGDPNPHGLAAPDAGRG